ncbi:PH domain-containing protein [Rhizobium laguerreae]|nr:PH domain-containing protein [Rhizobium laguerreae]
MTSNASERVVLTARPATSAAVFQLRNILKLGIAAWLATPQTMATMSGFLDRLRIPGVSHESGFLYIPSAILIFSVISWIVYQKTCSFTLTDERLIVRYGLLLRVEDEVELYRVVDVTQTIGIFQRIFGVGNVQVTSTDRTGTVTLPLIKSPSAVRNAIRTEAERCKSRRGSVRILE